MLSVPIVSRFNPYFMTDQEILSLNTGREKELDFAIDLIDTNIKRKTSLQHLLLYGPRGIGKSFFLRLLHIKLNNKNNVIMILLPEEQMNIYQPSDFLRVIKKRLLKKEESENFGSWFEESRDAWNKEMEELNNEINSLKTHIVVGIENFDILFSKSGAFFSKENQFLLRQYLTAQIHITFIASTLYPGIDSRYDQALFHTFSKYELVSWQESQHEKYLRKRVQMENIKVDDISLARLKALTHFTGGLPRITSIMVDILTKKHLVSTTAALAETIDNLTPFYQDLLDCIPHKSRLLFDTLIRGGEPCSQSELAKRVGTSQNVISQHFKWLQIHNYLCVEIPASEKKRYYSVRDRLFSHYYKMRYILPEKGKSKLCIMAEFLTRFYSSWELLNKAELFCTEGKIAEGKDIYEMVLEKAGILTEQLKWKDDLTALADAAKTITTTDFTMPETYEEARDLLNRMKDICFAKKDLPEKINWNNLHRNIILPFYIPYFTKILLLTCIINPDLMAKESYHRMITSLKGEPALLLKDKNEYEKLLFNEQMILEYIDLKLLKKIKLPNSYISVLIIIIISMISVGNTLLFDDFATITKQNLQKSLRILFQFIIKTKTQTEREDILSDYFILGCSRKNKRVLNVEYYSKLFDLHIIELQALKDDFIFVFIKYLCMVILSHGSIIYLDIITFITLIHKYPDILDPIKTLPIFFIRLLMIFNRYYSDFKSNTAINDLLTETKKRFSPDITTHLEPIEKTLLYLESGRDKTVLQKMEPELRVTVEAIVAEIKW